MLFFGAEAFNEVVMMERVITCLHLILILSAPMLIAAILAQVIIAIFQAATQVQEQTLSFVPKIVFTFLSVVWYGPWIASEVIDYTISILGIIASLGPKK